MVLSKGGKSEKERKRSQKERKRSQKKSKSIVVTCTTVSAVDVSLYREHLRESPIVIVAYGFGHKSHIVLF